MHPTSELTTDLKINHICGKQFTHYIFGKETVTVPSYFAKIHTQLKAQFGPQGHKYLQGCSSKSPWWKAMKAVCFKGYTKEVFIGEDEIFKASTRALYLHLPRGNIQYEGILTQTIEKIDIYSIVDSMLQESTKEGVVKGGHC